MNISLAIQHLYPNADPLNDFRVEDHGDGRGPFIAYWNEQKLGTQPPTSVLQEAYAQSELARVARDSDQKLRDIDLRSIRSLREYIATRADAPKEVKDREDEAKLERERRKKKGVDDPKTGMA